MDETHRVTARTVADPVESILAQMQGKTITSGWDVVCAMEADRINDLLAQQYVANFQHGTTLPPINATVPVIENISVQFVDLTLGPPLISFDPDLEPQELHLTINFISGLVNTVQASGSVTTLLGTQVISPGDEYSLTGVAPLTSVVGDVQANHDVVIDIANGTAFTANLGFQGGAAATLGQYFLHWLQTNIQNFQYKLGTLVYTPGGTDLTPAGTFRFATQFDATDPTDKGRLVLFIPTTYDPNGGSQTSLPIADIIPTGYTAALIVSSQALFANILKNFFQSAFSQYGVNVSASQAHPEVNYVLSLTAGAVNIGVVYYKTGVGSANEAHYFSGTASLGTGEQPTAVSVPLSGIQVAPQNNDIVVSGSVPWNQNLSAVIAVPRTEGYWNSGTVVMTATTTCRNAGSVDSADTISFSGTPTVNVPFDASSIWNSASDWNTVGQMIATKAQASLQQLFTLQLPQVNVFAVSNLLFPADHILSFSNVYVPGDLVIFGNVQKQGVAVTPVQATLGPGQTQQFTASGGAGVTWAAKLGTISSGGLYTAPSSILQAQTDVVSANGVGAAVVTLIPGGVLVSPSFVYMVPSNASTEPQQFTASGAGLGGDGVTWSIAPQVGSISFDGLYTPPWSGVQGLQAVTITATSKADPNVLGTALVVVAVGNPTDVAVTPSSVSKPVTPSHTQQFTANVIGSQDQSVAWSILPAGTGTISADGLYQAPATITTPQPVLIVATSQVVSVLFGTALVMIAPE